MAKRFREAVDVLTDEASRDPDHPAPRSFRWRGRIYDVVTILGHWREDAGYWAARSLEVPQRDLWRVEARRAPGHAGHAALPAGAGAVFELVRETGVWRLHRIWD